ncbi:MAG: apolipoprotein N-acyltransferase [Candidatus Omnitrophica bacterium]|nr:apolipoprotein N-acyltransferase [Candidatus Omnitrophota bacterium]
MLRKVEKRSINFKSVFLSLSSAALLVLAFPNFQISIFAWLALIPILYLIENSSAGKAFILSYLTGVFFFLGALYWLTYVSRLGYFILALYLALFFGLFGLFSNIFFKKFKNSRYAFLLCLILPSLWVLTEFLRGTLLTGFPWCVLGYTQYKNPVLIQIADITGCYGVSFLIVMVNFVLYSFLIFLLKKAPKEKIIFLNIQAVLLGITILVFISYANYRFGEREIDTGIRLSVVQGSIEQFKKWDPSYQNYIMVRYDTWTGEVARDKAELIIWPETAIPGFLDDDEIRSYLKEVAEANEAPLFTGAITYKSGAEKDYYFNSAVLFTRSGDIYRQYDKIHLVPLGEYIPFESRIPFFRNSINTEIGDLTAGREFTTFDIKAKDGRSYKYAAIICFEDIFPDLARHFARGGADFLINITNDAWFKESGEQLQHAQASVFRAVENRVAVIRAANNGFSCLISPNGIIEDWVRDKDSGSIYAPGFKTFELKIKRGKTFYSAHGDVFVCACLLMIGCYFIDFCKIRI